MPYINDIIHENGLDAYDGLTIRVDICSQEPTTYGEATTAGTYSLGNKTGIVFSAITDGATDGRRISSPAITDGSVTNSGTGTHWAITDGSAVLYATGALSASQGLTAGNEFTLDAVHITQRDATAV